MKRKKNKRSLPFRGVDPLRRQASSFLWCGFCNASLRAPLPASCVNVEGLFGVFAGRDSDLTHLLVFSDLNAGGRHVVANGRCRRVALVVARRCLSRAFNGQYYKVQILVGRIVDLILDQSR